MSPRGIKPGWKMVKFGEVVRQCKESVDRDNNPFERHRGIFNGGGGAGNERPEKASLLHTLVLASRSFNNETGTTSKCNHWLHKPIAHMDGPFS